MQVDEKMTRLNDSTFLREVLETCRKRNVGVWIFGGWAEELWNLTKPRIHSDIDLLYPAHDFELLDTVIREATDWSEILLKRFPHKRAVMIQGIMVEFFLVAREAGHSFTDFFGQLRFNWPEDTLEHSTSLSGITVNVASQEALKKYRQFNHNVRKAYAEYATERANRLSCCM